MVTFKQLIQNQFFLFMFARLIFGTGQKIIHPFLPEFARGLGVDITALAWVLSMSYIGSALGPFTGTYSDHYGRKKGMVLGLGVLLCGLCLLVFFPSVLTFGLALLGGTLGKIIFMPAFLAHIGDTVSYEKRGFVISLAEMTWALSYIIGVPVAGYIIEMYNWKAPFIFLAVLGVIALLLIIFRVRSQTPHITEGNSIFRNIKHVFNYRIALLGLFGGLMIGTGNEMVRVVLGSWFEDRFNLSVAVIGISTMTVGFAMLAGELFSAAAMDRIGKRRAINIALGMVIVVNLNIFWMANQFASAIIWLFLFFMFNEIAIVSSLTLSSELVPETRATMLATYISSITLGFAIGAPLAPFFYQWGFEITVLASTLFYPIALLSFNKIFTSKKTALQGALLVNE